MSADGLIGQPVWVLLRGLAREVGHWGAFPAVLQQEIQRQQPAARLLMLDLPGNGALHRESSPTQVATMVESCRAQLQQHGVTGPVHVLAMSLGAMVASDWAARYPQELSAGVLINTSLQPFSPFYHRLRPLNYLAFLLLSLSSMGHRRREAKVLAMTSNLHGKPDQILDHWVELQRLHPVGVRNSLRQLLAASRYRASQFRPAVPMLLLCSSADRLVDWRCSQAISRAWGAPLRMHVRAGHDLPLDDPLWVAQAVGEWLRVRRMQGLQEGQWH
ncbi:alpha/beta hydrolase [Paucibacter sp. B2R-40]|uniref:alpha/beta fold hydrolase n=1 Tax=Paucibacter sp. B2R-40 TaxID=2893554 RepID=UPI0021E36322|nr:alpha/beta hydrolase [Paucibacter sp. B2R-40]MCV2353927.1 alpha/beta hydrolase [Paucibacter sp. B2R-40]